MKPGQKLNSVLKAALAKASPSKEELEHAELAAGQFVSKLNKHLKPKRVKAIIGGSNKKQTQLKNTFEIDVFALFDYKKYSQNDKAISDVLEGAIKKAFKKAERVHGSRDYFQISKAPYLFEIIPILEVSSERQAKNITDVSPLHARWVARNAKSKLGEIRLAKSFMAGCGVYGAESYVRGFSGYACEILTINYGSFVKLLKAAAKWKEKQAIDPEKHYRLKNPMLELNKSKTEGPLIIIDPTQRGRNVTAALSKESFDLFRSEASKFLKHPSISFFRKKTTSKKELVKSKSKDTNLLIVEIMPEKNKKDVMGTALLSKYELLREAFLKNGFRVKKNSWQWDGGSSLLWFFISKKYPGKFEKREGPRISDKFNAERFRQKHRKAFISKGRLFAMVERKFQTPKKLVEYTLSGENFKKRIKQARVGWY